LEVTQITDPVGRSLNLTYDGSFRITSISDPIGRIVLYSYNSQGTLATVTDAAGGATSYGYDTQNRLLSITDPRGITYLQNTYDQNGRVIKQVAVDGGITSFSYTQLNAAVSTTVVQSTAAVAAVGGNAVPGAGTIPNVNTSPIALTVVTDPLGNQTTYHFNSAGFLMDLTDALGQKTVYAVDPGTNLTTSVTDALGRTTAYTYDANGNTTSITRLAGTPNAVTTSFAYDPIFNKLLSATDPLGLVTSFKYDNAGNLASSADPVGQKSIFTFDANGELTALTDPLGNTTHFSYSRGDLATTTDPLNRVTTRVSDGISQIVSISNPLGQTTQSQYNALSQVVQITDSQRGRTSFGYDSNGNLLSVGDALGNQTGFSYDNMDRVTTRTDPLGHSETYQYDLAGNLSQFGDRRGVVVKYTHDPLYRRILAQYGNESSVSYLYDSASRLVQTVDSITGGIVRGYDGLDRLISETTPEGNVSYSYDAAGRRRGMAVSGELPIAYSYDDDNRLAQINQGGTNVFLYYDADGRRTSVTLPNGITKDYTYDTSSQLTAIAYTLGALTLGNLAYSYDLGGRRISVGGSLARTGMPAAVASANYNANNQVTSFGPSSLSYDANGNLVGDGVNAYAWNARNQLVSISGSVSANFQYDALGRRVSKEVAGNSTNFVYDGLNPVEELSGGTVNANLLAGLGVDEYFQRTDSSATATYLTDAMGSTVALADGNGNPQTQYTYEPFGNTSVSGNSSNRFRYTGREDDGTGLYFSRARYYSPALSRFISEDPIGIAGRAENLYQYARNNPASYFDPLGLSAEPGRKPSPCSADGYRDADPDDAAAVLQEAKSYQDVPYSEVGPNSNYDGTDCSGLVYNSVRNSGINPSVGYSQANNIGNPGYRPLSTDESPNPGDVVVFPNPGGNGHVGFYDPINGSPDLYSATLHGVRDVPFSGFNKKGTITPQFYRVRVPCNP